MAVAGMSRSTLQAWHVLLLLLLAVSCLPLCLSWGGQGHTATARLAMSLFTADAVTLCNQLLPNNSGDISQIASWADSVRNQPAYSWSGPLHYADTPAWSCHYDMQRDCQYKDESGMCVDGAVHNYTARLLSPSVGFDQSAEAVKFLVHFIGDLHQPLHAGFVGDAGGNGVYAYFMNATRSATLHSLWDSALIDKRVRDDYSGSYEQWNDALLSRLNGQYKPNITQWGTCPAATLPSSLSSPPPSPLSLLLQQYIPCSGDWMQESAALCCSTVYIDEQGQRMNTSWGSTYRLGQPYYDRNIELVEQRILKAGVRMAAVINTVARLLLEPSASSSSSSSSSALPIPPSSSSSDLPSPGSSSSSGGVLPLPSSSSSFLPPSGMSSASSGSSAWFPYAPSSSAGSSSTGDSVEAAAGNTGVIAGVIIFLAVALVAAIVGYLVWRKNKYGLSGLCDSVEEQQQPMRGPRLMDDDDFTTTSYRRV